MLELRAYRKHALTITCYPVSRSTVHQNFRTYCEIAPPGSGPCWMLLGTLDFDSAPHARAHAVSEARRSIDAALIAEGLRLGPTAL